MLLTGILASAAACQGATGQPTLPLDGGTSGPEATLPEVGESLEPVATEPDSTSIPGFDGWSTINAGSVEVGETQSGFGMVLLKRATWSGAGRGVLFYTTIDGDFRISATVRATRTSDSSQTPGGDGTTQLAGLMARLQGSQENYVLIAVGSDASGLSLATASTTDDQTRLTGPAWPSGEAELKLCRSGSTFTLWKRAADSGDDWISAGTFERKGLSGTLQVGASLSSDSPPDLTARFDDLTLEPLEAGEAC